MRGKDFKKNMHLYEETGEQEYKDKATGRYYHRLLWRRIIDSIIVGNWYDDIDDLKLSIIKEKNLPMPKYNACYACSYSCEQCPLKLSCGYEDSPMSLFIKAYRKREKGIAINYALMIMNAWEV